jgi:hypothetical protein
MKRLALAIALCAVTAASAAADPGFEAYTIRIMKCAGQGVTMEIYLPHTVVFKRGKGATGNILAMPPTLGWYALDLSDALKGKPLEPVRLSISPDRKFLIVNQYTRKLPPTRIPVEGGTVDFDQRFARNAKCDALNAQQ